MQQTLLVRILLAAGLLGLAAYLMVPTVIYFSLDEQETLEVRSEKDAFSKHVPSWAPDKHIVPGLDLQGGIHIVLGVDLEKAIEDRARRSANRVRSHLEDKEIGFEAVDHLPEEGSGDRIQVKFSSPAEKRRFEQDEMDLFGDLAVLSSSDTEILFRVHPDYAVQLRKEAVGQTIKTINNRIDKIGVTEPLIQKRGDDQIQIQLPGFDDPEEAKSLIGRTAQLEFQMCDDETEFLTGLNDLPAGVSLARSGYQKPDGGQGNDIYLYFSEKDQSVEAVKEYLSGKVPTGTVVKFGVMNETGGEKSYRTYTLKAEVELTGDDLADARVSQGSPENPRPSVSLDFSPAGGRVFGELTGRNIGNRMAIVLEDIVDSAPVIQTAITGGSAQITMGRNATRAEMLQDANQLALVLKAGALPAPVQFREERSVGPSLGKDSVQRGKRAVSVGGLLVLLLMILYYRLAGVISVIGLIFNVSFVLAFLSWLGGTVTLPGLAGLLLTVGMAVDANIIIIERIREELRSGKTPRSAVAAGYDSAFSAIIDANVTTFIAGMVLWQFGTGPVQNFATTILIGTVSSVVSAVFITRIFFDLVVKKGPETLSV